MMEKLVVDPYPFKEYSKNLQLLAILIYNT